MDGKSITILKLYNQRNYSLSCYDIGIILDAPSISISNNVVELRELEYIDVDMLEKDKLHDNMISLDTKLHITQSGKSYLFDLKEDKKNFIIKSITIPFIVSIVSSIITTIITIMLKNHKEN